MNLKQQNLLMIVAALVFHSSIIKVLGNNLGLRQVPDTYPDGFIFSASTSAFQIEGAWDTDGKGPSVYDWVTHERPQLIADHSNADVAADYYHKYEHDIQLLQDLGAFRFSISWPRIFPNGTIDIMNEAGVQFYHSVLDELLKRGIQPVVTMLHFDLPFALEDKGGWRCPDTADHFANYADFLFKTYGDKVKWWMTINEPYYEATFNRFTGQFSDPPYDYIKGHNILRAHGKAYRIYDEKYRQSQGGKISLCGNGLYVYPKTNSIRDKLAAERYLQFTYGWMLHPVCSLKGDYPEVMKKFIAAADRSSGSPPRLPEFTPEDLKLVRGTCDYISINYYSSKLAQDGYSGPKLTMENDMRVITTMDPSLPVTHTGKAAVDPKGFRELLKWIKKEYLNKPVLITENGYDGRKGTDDTKRIDFHKSHLKALREAIYLDGCNVVGYSLWSFIDTFELTFGYTKNYGVVEVNFNETSRPRTVKKSGQWFQEYFAWLKTGEAAISFQLESENSNPLRRHRKKNRKSIKKSRRNSN